MNVVLIQLPIPRLDYGRQTGNIPLGAACLAQAVADLSGVTVRIVPESVSAYLGDRALIDQILSMAPDVVGFTAFSWNVDRALYVARRLKAARDVRIVFGGPEVTPDNPRMQALEIDARVCGEGEAVFRRLLTDPDAWDSTGFLAEPATAVFAASPSPYPAGLLEPEIERLMLLETQRGCPYRCGYCYYRKSRQGIGVKSAERVVDGVRWAVDRGLPELFVLDPSLNARPDLESLLAQIAAVNTDRRTALLSETRAEAITDSMADRFAAAGFTGFEIGLQTTNPEALAIMQRRTDLDRFVAGVDRLKARGIRPEIDLIVGLPGDDLSRFKQSVDFIVDHDMADDVQVFPLSVLHGTDFRRRAGALGIRFEAEPPYPVIETDGFSREEILMAFDYAESRLDTVFYPMPDLNLFFRDGTDEPPRDQTVRLGETSWIQKVALFSQRPQAALASLAGRLTQPYAVLIGPEVAADTGYLATAVAALTEANPFTPLELVFFEPARLPDTAALLSAIRLHRPHFLDHDLRLLQARAGNRAALFTLVSTRPAGAFSGTMRRQVYWWRHDRLPELSGDDAWFAFDGILIDSDAGDDTVCQWQDRFADDADDLPLIGFARRRHHLRWQAATAGDQYWDGAFADS